MGVPPHRYLIAWRVERAKALFGDRTRAINDIALDSGLASPSSYATSFRKATGLARFSTDGACSKADRLRRER
jgi:AraC-like DNA-binding protein